MRCSTVSCEVFYAWSSLIYPLPLSLSPSLSLPSPSLCRTTRLSWRGWILFRKRTRSLTFSPSATATMEKTSSMSSRRTRTTSPTRTSTRRSRLVCIYSGAEGPLSDENSGTSDKGQSEIGTTSLQRTLVAAPC